MNLKLFIKTIRVISVVVLFFILIFNFIYAAEEPIFKSYQDIQDFFDKLANIIATLFWTAAVISAIYAAFLFLAAGGNEEKTTKAKKMFLYTVIAIVIGLIAFGLPELIKNILKLR